jgi:hypothetical protein
VTNGHDADGVEPSLAWVIVDGLPRHVSEFAALEVRRRPLAFCHVCGERLILKLGAVRRHHAAHRPGATCPTTHPETALHSDCKLALAAALLAAASPTASLTFRVTCVGDERESCERSSVKQWTGGWDEVRIERRVDAASQPDITLVRAGVAIGALEIVVSHAVDPGAIDALARLGIPWAEIEADPLRRAAAAWDLDVPLRRAAAAWDLDVPLDARRFDDPQPWRCEVHASAFAMRAAARAVRESAPVDCPRATTLRAARVVDLYHRGGRHERFVYRVLEDQFAEGSRRVLRLLRGNLEIVAIEIPVDDADQANAKALSAGLRDDTARLRRDADTIADSPMRWARDAAAEFIVSEALFDRRRPDPTVLVTTYPRRWFYAPTPGVWFLPDDMRDVHWNRGPDDVFAAHPASRRQVSGRARAAPEGSWSTFIFARRPTAAMLDAAPSAHAEVAPGVARFAVTVERRHGRRRALSHRVVCVITRVIDTPALSAAIATVRAGEYGSDALWLSSPRDWQPVLAGVAWAPAGCDSRGRGAVVVDGVGVVRADAFMRALAEGDRRFDSSNIRRAMAERVERLSTAFLSRRLERP